MRTLYEERSANYPREKTDKFFVDYENEYSYTGFVDKTFKFIEDFQLLDATLWRRFVQQFREDADFDGGWRGEYWGKMMRGASFVYAYTKNEDLYNTLTKTVSDMIESADDLGRISSYYVDHEFDGWDIWGRKYVLLGMQYFLEICKDKELAEKIIKSMKGQVDYLITKFGNEEGKRQITSATRHWRGLNSSSVLEPVVRLYSLTGEQKYLDFATYIVDCGGTDIVSVFDLAYENQLKPYQYPVTKAYEMTSCFEGLLEYYRITGNEKHKIALINYANNILEYDFTVIGCSGCTHELFDYSKARQANTTNDVRMQETCVTVTLMKFFYQLNLLTGDARYADAFETSFYNAYLGSVNTEKIIDPILLKEHPDWNLEPFPFDSYSPLTANTRGVGIGGLKVMSDNHYYGCCACIGSAGAGLVPKMHLLATEKGFAMNLYIDGKVTAKTPQGEEIVFETETKYPVDGEVLIKVKAEKDEKFELLLRNPSWSKETKIALNGEEIEVNNGYVSIEKVFADGDEIKLSFDMRTEAIYPIPYGELVLMNKVIWGKNYVIPTYDKEDEIAKNHIALRRGPVMLSQDNRLGYSVDEPVSVKVENGYVDVKLTDENIPYDHIIGALVPLTDGSFMKVTDYSSAGKTWTEESKMAVWFLTK